MMKIVAKAHNWRAYGYRRQVAANHRAYPVVDHNRVRKKKKKKMAESDRHPPLMHTDHGLKLVD